MPYSRRCIWAAFPSFALPTVIGLLPAFYPSSHTFRLGQLLVDECSRLLSGKPHTSPPHKYLTLSDNLTQLTRLLLFPLVLDCPSRLPKCATPETSHKLPARSRKNASSNLTHAIRHTCILWKARRSARQAAWSRHVDSPRLRSRTLARRLPQSLSLETHSWCHWPPSSPLVWWPRAPCHASSRYGRGSPCTAPSARYGSPIFVWPIGCQVS